MYFELFKLLQTYLYGSDVVLDEFQTLVLTEMATIGVVFVAALPFMLVGLVVLRLFR